jgi:crotonobetainyl-CoA:carnitine CoA-transferase CaiB-like acyl-CoA transferase
MLEGIKVVEFATYIAAPSAGGLMTDWGADVIKIEALNGDPIRRFFGSLGVDMDSNPVFDLDNRGKRGIALDTSTTEGRDTLKRLIKDADVFLTNLRPGSLDRAGLNWDSLKEINPKLIFASVTGYGLEGEEKDRPGFDIAAFWARSGVGKLTTPKGTEPFGLRTAFGDHVTGLSTVNGILAALLDRARTGEGCLVETSLLRTGIYALGSDYAIQLKMGRVASTKSRHEMAQPLSNFFKTKDDEWLCIVLRQSEEDWHNIARTVGLAHLVEDERFGSAKNRKKNSASLVDELDKAFVGRDLKEWETILDNNDVVWAPFQSAAQVVNDPQAIAAGAFVDMPDQAGGTYRAPAGPVRFHGRDDGPKGPAPHTGEHTVEILKEAGLSQGEIEELRSKKIIL